MKRLSEFARIVSYFWPMIYVRLFRFDVLSSNNAERQNYTTTVIIPFAIIFRSGNHRAIHFLS